MPVFRIGGIFSATDIGSKRVRLASDWSLSDSAIGETLFSNVDIDDPNDDLAVDVKGFKGFIAEEPTAPEGNRRILTGYVDERTINRGRDSHRTGASRTWGVQIVGLNAIASFQILKHTDAIRPAETDVQRVAWLLGTEEFGDGLVNDLGFVSTDNARQLDANDYRDSYPAAVLNDCIAPHFGKVWFCYYDETEDAIGLFYDDFGATTYESTLSISNVLDDLSDTCFAPYLDAPETLNRNPDGVFDGILYRFANSQRHYEQLESTHTEFNIHRDELVVNERVGRMSTAVSFSRQFLARASAEADTISVAIEVPLTKVNDIRPGMRIQVRFSHLPGYEEFTWLRVAERTVSQPRPVKGTYLIDLTLVDKAPVGSGGGGGTPTEPWVPCPPATPVAGAAPLVVQESEGTGSQAGVRVLDDAPTPGHTLVWTVWEFGGGTIPASANGWTLVDGAEAEDSGDGHQVGVVGVYYRVAEEGETGDYSLVGTRLPLGWNGVGILTEYDQTLSPIDVTKLDTQPGSTDLDVGSATPTASAPAAFVGGYIQYNGLIGNPVAPDAGLTETVDRSSNSFTGGIDFRWAWSARVEQDSGDAAASTVAGTSTVAGVWAGIVVAFTGAVVETPETPCPPPVPGQHVNPLNLPVTDCSQLIYQTPHPYAPLSLRVLVRDTRGELVHIIVAETDPDHGYFTLPYAICGFVVTQTIFLTARPNPDEPRVILFSDDGIALTARDGSIAPGSVLIVEYDAGAGEAPGAPPAEPPTPTIPPGTGVGNIANGLDAAALAAAIEAHLAAGRTPTLYPSGSYLLTSTCVIDASDGGVLDLNGAVVKGTGDFQTLRIVDPQGFTIKGGVIDGFDSSGVYHAGDEDAHGVAVQGGDGMHFVAPLFIRNVRGDGIYAAQNGTTPGTNMTIGDGVQIGPVGRMGIAPVAWDNGTIGAVRFVGAMYRPLDFEPDTNVSYTQTVRHWTADGCVIDCDIRGTDGSGTGWVYIGTPYSGHAGNLPLIDDITVTNCVVRSTGPTTPHAAMLVDGAGDAVISNVVLTDNTSTNDWGVGMTASTVSTLTVTGNVMQAPNSSYTATGSSGVTITGNT